MSSKYFRSFGKFAHVKVTLCLAILTLSLSAAGNANADAKMAQKLNAFLETVVSAAPETKSAELAKQCHDGELSACYQLGYAAIEGQGLDKAVATGIALYHYSCEEGYANACNDLGYRYSAGLGVEQDLAV